MKRIIMPYDNLIDETYIQKFWANIDVDQKGCWVWVGKLLATGYGYMYHPEYSRSGCAHRLSYALANGPIPIAIIHLASTQIIFLLELRQIIVEIAPLKVAIRHKSTLVSEKDNALAKRTPHQNLQRIKPMKYIGDTKKEVLLLLN